MKRPKPAARSVQPKKAEPNTAIIVAVIGLVGTLCAALISSPIFQDLFSRKLTATLFSTATETKQPTPYYPAEITDANGAPMRLVPAGEFTMGSENGDNDEKPIHQVYLDAFYMDIYEVTNALYKACVDAGDCTPPHKTNSYTRDSYYGNSEFDDYPVIYVEWNQAKAYCEWRGASLPTEAQWEKAARGTDGRTSPWGEGISCDKTNYANCKGDTTKVGSYLDGVSPYGLYDMVGNV